MTSPAVARRLHVRGVVQGVGFRPFVFRLAEGHGIGGWVVNDPHGVEIHVEGAPPSVDAFLRELRAASPPSARIDAIDVASVAVEGFDRFSIRMSRLAVAPTAGISVDLPMCAACERELFEPGGRRAGYPYITCSDCGPRFSIVRSLPYDRERTTMAPWTMCESCAREYHDPHDRRFHAQPLACSACGPHYMLPAAGGGAGVRGDAAIRQAAARLTAGAIVAIKGVGGYHLACDAEHARTVALLRERKFRKERPFAVMVRDLDVARRLAVLTPEAEALLKSVARPIVLAPKRLDLHGVAPDNTDVGVMLPYAPVHALLFAAGAPEALVMTSGNRSSEPIAYEDGDALARLTGIADAWLVGDRPIARRLDDSVARIGPFGPVILRRSRGYAPGAVATLPAARPVLALGADLKSAVTLVVEGQAYGGQHIGDLEHQQAFEAFRSSIVDLLGMYGVRAEDALVVHDLHPQYRSTVHAEALEGLTLAVQHHRAHVASVLAERGELDCRVIGVAMDGSGYGDDGAIWGGELFVGSVAAGFTRVGSLRPAALPGGDAASRHPVQAAAGFLHQLDVEIDFTAPPFGFPVRFSRAKTLIDAGLRTFRTSSAGRLFDTVAALLGFTRPVTFEGQAAMWLEHLAAACGECRVTPSAFPWTDGELDWRPALREIAERREGGAPAPALARAFHRGLAGGLAEAIVGIAGRERLDAVVLSGGVFQNELLVRDLQRELAGTELRIWTNQTVPPNDGGISLGQAAIAACGSAGGRKEERG